MPDPLGFLSNSLQDHGVDKVFFLENDNVDASQKNVIFLARGEKANQPIAVAGMYVLDFLISQHLQRLSIFYLEKFTLDSIYWVYSMGGIIK